MEKLNHDHAYSNCPACEQVGQWKVEAKLEGIRRFLSDERLGVSTDISESVSYGYGDLNDNGFWEFPVPERLVQQRAKLRAAEEMAKLLQTVKKELAEMDTPWSNRLVKLIASEQVAWEKAGKGGK